MCVRVYSSRQYDDTFNVFEGIFSNKLFMTVNAIMVGLQILIVFVGGPAFPATPLTGVQWAVSLVLGALTLAVGAAIRCIPNWPFQASIDALSKQQQEPTRVASLEGVAT